LESRQSGNLYTVAAVAAILASLRRHSPQPPTPIGLRLFLAFEDVAPLRKREKEGAPRASTASICREIARCQFRQEKERSPKSK